MIDDTLTVGKYEFRFTDNGWRVSEPAVDDTDWWDGGLVVAELVEALLAARRSRDTLVTAATLADNFLALKGYTEHDPLVRGALRSAIDAAKEAPRE